jgi:hypothetical protein
MKSSKTIDKKNSLVSNFMRKVPNGPCNEINCRHEERCQTLKNCTRTLS